MKLGKLMIFNFRNKTIFFFFLISKNDIYTKGYFVHERHRANPKITRRKKQRKYIKENQETD